MLISDFSKRVGPQTKGLIRFIYRSTFGALVGGSSGQFTALMCPKGRNAHVVRLENRPPSFVVGSLDLYCVYSMRSPGTNGEVAVYGQMNSRKPDKLYKSWY